MYCAIVLLISPNVNNYFRTVPSDSVGQLIGARSTNPCSELRAHHYVLHGFPARARNPEIDHTGARFAPINHQARVLHVYNSETCAVLGFRCENHTDDETLGFETL